MKRSLIVLACLGLALSACSNGTSIGKNVGACKDCLSSLPPTASARPKVHKSAAPKSAPKPTTVASTAPAGHTYTIVLKSNATGYQPNTLRAYAGDTIIFQNLDTATPSGHTFTGDNNEWSSGVIKPGKSWTWKINLKPGIYHWHDEQVPYLVGGPFEVIAPK